MYIDLSQPEKAVVGSVSVRPSGSQVHKKSAGTANLYLKVLNPLNKKKFVMHTLRDFPCDLETPDELREEIFCQCGEEVVSGQLNFDIGYFTMSNKYWVNSEKDLADAWSLLQEGGRLTFWCTGVDKEEHGQTRKGKRSKGGEGSEEVAVSKKKRVSSEDKSQQVTEIKTELKEKHGTKYNELQYRLWAEVIVSGMHSDQQNPPKYPMFGAPRNITKSPAKAKQGACSTTSPGSQTIELRGKCIQQIKELVSLRDMGALNEEEFERERLYYVNKMQELK